MFDSLRLLFSTDGFPPRWHCGTWSDAHGWVHIVADVAICLAYAAIPTLLVWFTWRRKDAPFLPIFWLFAAFILSCGLTHLVEATIFWNPWYRFSALMKTTTAIVSWVTVIALIPAIPRALSLPGLATTNERLKSEIDAREKSDEELRRSNEDLKRFTDQIIGREERMIELKREVDALLSELGRPRRYETG